MPAQRSHLHWGRQVEWTASKGTTMIYGCTGMIVDRALIPDAMVIAGSLDSLQMIDVPLANVYLDFQYYKGHCKVMCVSSPVYPVIIGNVKGALQM